MTKWFKNQSASIKVMIILIIVSIVGIIINWNNVSNDVYEAINSRIEVITEDTK